MPALPTNFSTLLTSQLGAATAGELLAGYDLPRQTAIRLNRAKAAGLHPNLARVAHAERGYLLPERPVFALDPLWHAGVYYVQEANSMLLGKVMAQVLTGTETAVLDLCAAPGGKSTLLTDALPEGCLLVSNEVVKARQPRLAENLARWGTASHAITGLDPAELGKRLPGFFDVVVVDAPCSGEGLFRKEPVAVGEWSPVHVQHCAARQRRILSDIWPVIKPGGYLIYSTCTLNADEDEASLRHLLTLPDAQAVPIAHQPSGALPALDGLPGLRMAPDASGGEGFFISLVRKQGIDWDGFAYSSGKKSRLQEPGRKLLQEVQRWAKPNAPLRFFEHHNGVFALHAQAWKALNLLLGACPIISAGTEAAEVAKSGFCTPSADWATSVYLNPDAFATARLTHRQALQYLHLDAPELESPPQGIALMQYQGYGVGWGKFISTTRFNNLYPKPRRILQEVENAPEWSLAE